MNIFSNDFLDTVRRSIIQIVRQAVNALVEQERKPESRYLNKKEAIKYIGGMYSEDFDNLIKNGLKVVVIPRKTGGESKRYDVKDIDEFLAMYKK